MTGTEFVDKVMSVMGAVVGLLATAVPIGGGIAWFLNWRKRRADTTKVEVDTGKTMAEIIQVHATARNLDAKTLTEITAVYQGVINELRGEMKETNERLDKLETESKEKDVRIEKLEKENRELRWHVSQLEQELKGKEDKA